MKYLDFWKALVFLSGALILSGAIMYTGEIVRNPQPIPCFLFGGILGVAGLIGLFVSAKKQK